MRALSLTMTDWRNITQETLEFDEKVNILCGDNAQGKTNTLEALWMFAACRPFRSAKERDLIRFGAESFDLSLRYISGGRETASEIRLRDGRKRELFTDGVRLKKTAELIGSFRAVLFAPEHLNLVKEGPGERRRFLDIALSRLRPAYLDRLSAYQKILDQRNALLRRIAEGREKTDLLPVWDEKLASAGAYIALMRRKYVALLEKYAAAVHRDISDGREELTLHYAGPFPDGCENVAKEDAAAALLQRLRDHRAAETAAGITLCGPHRDDIEIAVNGRPARQFCSQGQQRSSVLSLKLAEGEIEKADSGEYPVFLLDDMMSELDAGRQDFIVNRIAGRQVIITCCDPAIGSKFENGKFFSINDGKIHSQ